jgi:DNA helicase-2/ATP-dependent DNA helicase PcrA
LTLTQTRSATGLSPEQQKAVEHPGGPLLVLAAPGAGKTRLLTHRVAHLVRQGVDPASILVSTFTNRATNEFRHRLRSLIGDQASRLWMGTLHATGARILRRFPEAAGFTKPMVILDEGHAQRVIFAALKSIRMSEDAISLAIARERISRWKGLLLTPREAQRQLFNSSNWEDRKILQLYEAYQRQLTRQNAVDFDDLVMRTVQLLKANEHARRLMQREHILLDEFQDTDPAQWQMIQLLLDPDRWNLTVVSDPDQSIYAYRGAEPRIVLGLAREVPDLTTISLGRNYRSTQTIVQGAVGLIRNNTERIAHRIYSENEIGVPIVICPCKTEREEAAEIALQVGEVLRETELHYKDVAVLYRMNAQSEPLEEAFLKAGIPYHVVGTKFFDRREIKDAIGLLRVLSGSEEDKLIEEVMHRPRRRIAKKSWDGFEAWRKTSRLSLYRSLQVEGAPVSPRDQKKVEEWITRVIFFRGQLSRMTLPDLLSHALEEFGFAAHYTKKETAAQIAAGISPTDNLGRLMEMVADFDGDAHEALPDFLSHVDMMSGDDPGNIGNTVQLMTCHAAKGSEYPIVFIAGVEEGVLPHWRALKEAEDPLRALEEERRLCYVAMTRAMKQLRIFHASSRSNRDGRSFPAQPSRFLGEIPESLVDWRQQE